MNLHRDGQKVPTKQKQMVSVSFLLSSVRLQDFLALFTQTTGDNVWNFVGWILLANLKAPFRFTPVTSI